MSWDPFPRGDAYIPHGDANYKKYQQIRYKFCVVSQADLVEHADIFPGTFFSKV